MFQVILENRIKMVAINEELFDPATQQKTNWRWGDVTVLPLI